MLDHNHELSREEFTGMRVGNKVTVKELELVELLSTAKAPPRKIAEVLSKNSGLNFKAKDVKNLIAKKKKQINGAEGLEKCLDKVRERGGTVCVEKDPETGYVRVLWIQPVEMKDMVARVQPTVFQNDTTFKF